MPRKPSSCSIAFTTRIVHASSHVDHVRLSAASLGPGGGVLLNFHWPVRHSVLCRLGQAYILPSILFSIAFTYGCLAAGFLLFLIPKLANSDKPNVSTLRTLRWAVIFCPSGRVDFVPSLDHIQTYGPLVHSHLISAPYASSLILNR
jgi:hypothetical protein